MVDLKERSAEVKHLILFLIMCLMVFLIAACVSEPAGPTPMLSVTAPSQQVKETPIEAPNGEAELLDQVVVTPTPAPTATPGVINETIAEISIRTGLNRQILLGLTGEDWLNVLVSLLIVLLGVFFVVRIIYFMIERVIKSTPNTVDDRVLSAIGGTLRWFFWTLIVEFALTRLLFLPDEWKQSFNQFFYTVYVLILTTAAWKMIDLAVELFREKDIAPEERARQSALIPAVQRSARVLLLIIAIAFISNNYGVNFTYLIALLGVGGLALSLAAQDTISDAINGFLILLDRPYREGDRIRIHEMDTWGDVVEIGTRTTRIRTLDNRMVVVPNSKIGKNQVVNYSYPDTRFRIETEVSIAYGSDLNQVRAVLKQAVRGVQGVLPDKPVDALLVELGDSALKFRVRWWIESFTDTNYIYDMVHDAIYEALNAAGIDSPFNTYDVNLRLSSEQIGKYVRELRDDQDNSLK
jgi:small-conductance mechanosensitive channel